jgi:N-acetylneuraminate synthase
MRPFIIAEIGINHNGDINLAERLIDLAKEAGCQAVKFQKRTVNTVYSKEFLDSPRESPWGTTQREQKEGLEFGKKEFDIISKHCKQSRIDWFASAWDIDSQKFLRQYNLKYNKVASAMLTYLPLLEVVAEEKKHTFIATGMSTYEEIDRAVEIFNEHSCPFTLMHCVSTYPSEDNEINLRVIESLKERYNCDIGYSGHENDILPSILAAALGTTTIERHITLDKNLYGSDQSVSINGDELKLLVKQIHRIPIILGDENKVLLEKEAEVSKKLRYFENRKSNRVC